jgi:hypothetical protein
MAERRRGPLPLESSNWWPLEAAIECRLEQTRSETLTTSDLNGALVRKTKPLRSLVRHADGRRELLLPSAWIEDFHLSVWFLPPSGQREGQDNGGVAVFSRRTENRVFGRWFFIWKPDFERIFVNTVPAPAAPAEAPETSGKKRGRPQVHNWPDLVVAIGSKLQETPKKTDGRIVEELQGWCRLRGEKEPPDSELRKYIAAVRRVLGQR